MAPPGGVPNNVSYRELHKLLEKQDERARETDRIINEKLDGIRDCVSRQDERVKHNTDEIKRLRSNSNIYDAAIGIGAAIGAAIAAVIGTRQ